MAIEEIKEKIKDLTIPLLERHGAFFVDSWIRYERGGRVVQVFVDTDRGITIDECAEISRDLSRELDLFQLLSSPYHLEVSSPGTDKPLKLLRQYHKNIGRRFRVKYAGETESKTISATLVSVVDDQLTFQLEEGESVFVAFDRIIESKEQLPW